MVEPRLIVLAAGDTQAARSNARGHLFENFVAHLLHRYGYEPPSASRLNQTQDGIELDVTARHELTAQSAIVECKAYSSPVSASALNAFYGKLVQARFEDSRTHGFFVALPRLTSAGDEQARNIDANDPDFTYLNAEAIVRMLRDRGDIAARPAGLDATSDPAVVIASHGLFAATLVLDQASGTPQSVAVWSQRSAVPDGVLQLLADTDYAQGLSVFDAGGSSERKPVAHASGEPTESVIVRVEGSTSDFEYQLPASPRFFVGRKRLVEAIDNILTGGRGVVVMNAQSGWGKSSLALMLEERTKLSKGYALVVDSRTAVNRRYVTDVLREAATTAADSGLLTLPSEAAWGTLASAISSLARSSWDAQRGPLVIFFDQFENVFRDEALTREFRDLALAARELSGRLVVGFAWKTDLVDWTEGHPYRLRDEIRASACVLRLEPLVANEVDTILRRLEKAIDQQLTRDLRQRLREYSQGLPWLLKKLSGHILREVIEGGASQERLVSEALNVQSLFESDLAELAPIEQEALRHVARYAPIGASEVTERFPAAVVQSLLDKRLIVPVGGRLDTYWDIFRDYLNTGRVPVEDSYIIRQSPKSVSRLVRLVVSEGDEVAVPYAAGELETSENAIYNLSRELRLLGLVSYAPNRVKLSEDIAAAADKERAIRSRVGEALRRHRSYSTFIGLADRAGSVPLSTFARALPSAFPAVAVSDKTWLAYARAFLLWFQYAGLVDERPAGWVLEVETDVPAFSMLSSRMPRRIRKGFPHDPPGPSLELLRLVHSKPGRVLSPSPADRRAAGPLLAIGALEESQNGQVRPAVTDLIVGEGEVNRARLRALIERNPGGRAGLAVLARNPAAKPLEVGRAIRDSVGAHWADSTCRVTGKHFRAWAREAGVSIAAPPRREIVGDSPPTLWRQSATPDERWRSVRQLNVPERRDQSS